MGDDQYLLFTYAYVLLLIAIVLLFSPVPSKLTKNYLLASSFERGHCNRLAWSESESTPTPFNNRQWNDLLFPKGQTDLAATTVDGVNCRLLTEHQTVGALRQKDRPCWQGWSIRIPTTRDTQHLKPSVNTHLTIDDTKQLYTMSCTGFPVMFWAPLSSFPEKALHKWSI